MDDTLREEQKLTARAVLAREGRGFAEEIGLGRTNNPASLFGLLVTAVIVAPRGESSGAARAAHEVTNRWHTATDLTSASEQDIAKELGAAVEGVDRGDGDDSASDSAATLQALATSLSRDWDGDLRALREEAGQDPARERELLTALHGVDDGAVDVFLREVQVLWPEVAPFADTRALRAASALGLGESAEDLARYGEQPEKIGRLAGALARIDVEGAHDEVQRAAAG
jgi:transcriptional regulator with XRE-family HTH domain